MVVGPKIRSLERGLVVMRELSVNGPLTVSETAQNTRLPRQTVSRILFFLEDLGYVEKAGREKRYVLTDQILSLSEGVRQKSWITQIAKPEMDALCREVLWPVALALPRNLEMEIVYDTDPISPLVMRPAPIGLHIPFVTSISGRVFLAHSSEKERDAILDAILKVYPNALDDIDLSEHLLRQQLETIREQGFFCDHMPHKAHSSLAAPVYHQGGIKAVLDIRFPIKSLSAAEATAKFSGQVTRCATAISEQISQI